MKRRPSMKRRLCPRYALFVILICFFHPVQYLTQHLVCLPLPNIWNLSFTFILIKFSILLPSLNYSLINNIPPVSFNFRLIEAEFVWLERAQPRLPTDSNNP